MTGIILAGGQSSRMGRDKALLPWANGGTLLSAAVDKLKICCQEIVIVGPQRELDRTVHWVSDRYYGYGPLAGIQAGLVAARCDSSLVLACDIPFVPVRLLKALVGLSKDVDLVIPIHSGGYEPLCAWYHRQRCLPEIEKMLTERCFSLMDLLPRVRVARLEINHQFPGVGAAKIFANLNTPADYEVARLAQNAWNDV